MATDRTQLTRQQQEWIDTIYSDPELFVALAEERGLADTLRQRLNERQGQPDDGQRQHDDGSDIPWQVKRTIQQRTDQRNALARAIVQNARGAGLHDAPAPNGEKQDVRMVDLVRLAHELGSRAIQGNQAIRVRDSLTEKLYQAGLAAELVDATPNPDSSQTLQTMDAHRIIDGLAHMATNQKETLAQRDRLATAIAEAATSAGVVRDGVNLTGPQLLLLINDLGMAAKQTVGRNEMLAHLQASGERIITDADAMEAIKRLDKSYYRHWRKDTMLGDDRQGYVSGNIQSGDLALVVEYARNQLLTHNGLKSHQEATEATKATATHQDERLAIEHAMDVLSKHGDGVTSAGAMETLQSLLDRTENALPKVQTDPEPLLEWWGHLQDDYQKYASGDPSVPFSSFRQTLDQFMEAAQNADIPALALHAQLFEGQSNTQAPEPPQTPRASFDLPNETLDHWTDGLSAIPAEDDHDSPAPGL